MTNELLEELWEIRREIEGENQKNMEKLLAKFKKRQKQTPSRYFSGKPKRTLKQKTH